MTLSTRLKTLFSLNPDKSQADLARFAGVKPPSVNDWLSGKTKKMSGPTLINVALYFSVDPMWLATGNGLPPTTHIMDFGAELTSHVNPSLHQASSGASAPATLQNALEFLAGYLSALDAGDRARAVRDIADLADEPQAVAKITARIEAMASPAFTDKNARTGEAALSSLAVFAPPVYPPNGGFSTRWRHTHTHTHTAKIVPFGRRARADHGYF